MWCGWLFFVSVVSVDGCCCCPATPHTKHSYAIKPVPKPVPAAPRTIRSTQVGAVGHIHTAGGGFDQLKVYGVAI